MKSLLRGLSWLAKGLLLAMAVGALVLWNASEGGLSLWARGSGFRVGPQKVEFIGLYGVGTAGRIILMSERIDYLAEPHLSEYRRVAAARGTRWDVSSELSSWNDGKLATFSRPYSWQSYNLPDVGYVRHGWQVSTHCWVVAVVAGAWPVMSIGVMIWRRFGQGRRLRRRGFEIQAAG